MRNEIQVTKVGAQAPTQLKQKAHEYGTKM